MAQSPAFAHYYEAARDACGQPKLVANWLMGEVSKRLNADELTIEQCPVDPGLLGALIANIKGGAIANAGARQAFDQMWRTGALTVSVSGVSVSHSQAAAVGKLIKELGLEQMNDSGALEAIVAEVVAANPRSVEEYKSGKDKAFNALVGQVMKASQGKANPAQASELLKKKLA